MTGHLAYDRSALSARPLSLPAGPVNDVSQRCLATMHEPVLLEMLGCCLP